MKRDSRGSMAYWDKWIGFCTKSIGERWERPKLPSGSPEYRPQYVFELTIKHLELSLRRYSRGDAVSELSQHFAGLLDAWEEAERLGKDVWSDEVQYARHSWSVNLDHYIDCFWLTGLALTLQIPDDQWQRLVVLMGNEGEDALLDRVIATRQPDRKVGDRVCFPNAYGRLLAVIDAPTEQRSSLLLAYLDTWFHSLRNSGSPNFPRAFRTPSWWEFCANEALGMKGGYFGCWCVEAVAVAHAFGIDDSPCIKRHNYPGDLRQDNRCPRYPDPEPALPPPLPSQAITSSSWLSRLLKK